MKDLAPKIEKSLFQNMKEFSTATVYEITTTANHLPFGIAIADILQFTPHFHKLTIETYTVVQGTLEVSLDQNKYLLSPGDVIKILPNVIHSARSLGDEPARITVTTIPEFSPDDNYLVTDEMELKQPSDATPMQPLETKPLSRQYDYLAPDGSEIRLLPEMHGGSLAHCLLPAGKTSIAVSHRTVEELWFCISGKGEVWRKKVDFEQVDELSPGVSVTIPTGTHFQFRNTGDEPLCILITTMPPWPGADEAVPVPGKW